LKTGLLRFFLYCQWREGWDGNNLFNPTTFVCLSQDLDFQRHVSWSYYFQLLKVALSTINQWLTGEMVFHFTGAGNPDLGKGTQMWWD
jgi:hypothetical protein